LSCSVQADCSFVASAGREGIGGQSCVYRKFGGKVAESLELMKEEAVLVNREEYFQMSRGYSPRFGSFKSNKLCGRFKRRELIFYLIMNRKNCIEL
jgi:hypothetical protein